MNITSLPRRNWRSPLILAAGLVFAGPPWDAGAETSAGEEIEFGSIAHLEAGGRNAMKPTGGSS